MLQYVYQLDMKTYRNLWRQISSHFYPVFSLLGVVFLPKSAIKTTKDSLLSS